MPMACEAIRREEATIDFMMRLADDVNGEGYSCYLGRPGICNIYICRIATRVKTLLHIRPRHSLLGRGLEKYRENHERCTWI
jgi:hypothetical protein